jgi:hypothetical protein
MAAKKLAPKRKPKISDAQRHERFVNMAKEVEASKDQSDFDRALKAITAKLKPHRSD